MPRGGRSKRETRVKSKKQNGPPPSPPASPPAPPGGLSEQMNLDEFQASVETASKHLGKAHSLMGVVNKLCDDVVRRAGRSAIAPKMENRWSWEDGKLAKDCKDWFLVFIDFRLFKQVNAVHGMDGGNMAIGEFDRHVQKFLRPNTGRSRGWKESKDWRAFHYGGDEFILLCSGVVWKAFKEWWPANARFEVFHDRGAEGEGAQKGERLACTFEVEANAGWVKGDDRFSREELRSQAEEACRYSKREKLGTLFEYRSVERPRGSVREFRFECDGKGCHTSGVLSVEHEKTGPFKCPVCGAALKEGQEAPHQECAADRRKLPRD